MNYRTTNKHTCKKKKYHICVTNPLSSIAFVHAQTSHETPYSTQLRPLIIWRKAKITLENKN